MDLFIKVHVILFIYLLNVSIINSASYTVVDSLYNNLTMGYNKYLRPETNLTSSTYIHIDFYLLNLQEINAVDGTVSITGYFVLIWFDRQMTWTPSEYDDINYLVLPHDKIWKPPLLNSNSAKQFKIFGISDTFIQLYPNGAVHWFPGENLKFSCNIDTSYFPFDTQQCEMDIIAWGYKEGDILFRTISPTIQTGAYTDNNEWDLVNSTATADISDIPPKVKYKFFYKRRPLFLLINLIFPVVFMALVNICVFFLPQDSGERVGFSITLLLAMVVFLTIAQGMLPATAQPRLSAICIILLVDLIMSGMIVVSVIFSSWLYYKTSCVPSWVTRFVCCKLYHRATKSNQIEDISADSKKAISKIDNKMENTYEATWQQVANCWDTLSLIFYILIFVGGNIAFAIDIITGTT